MESCPNVERNLPRCTCVYQPQKGVWCKFKGFCCGCIFNSIREGTMPACVTDAVIARQKALLEAGTMPPRPELPAMVACDRREANFAACPCTYEPRPGGSCQYKGLCCECVAHHLTEGKRPTCLRNMVS